MMVGARLEADDEHVKILANGRGTGDSEKNNPPTLKLFQENQNKRQQNVAQLRLRVRYAWSASSKACVASNTSPRPAESQRLDVTLLRRV